MRRIEVTTFVAFLLTPWASPQETPVFHASTSIVHVTISVTDHDGRPIRDLKGGEFQLFDNGKPRDIQYFGEETNSPLVLGLIIDMSGSQARFWERHRSNVRRFIGQVLGPKDSAFLVAVPAWSVLATDLTSNHEVLFEGVDSLGRVERREPFGGACEMLSDTVRRNCGTLLWNGVWASAKQKLLLQQARKALIVMSDGLDTGSQHSLSETIQAAQSADTPVYTIEADPIPIAANGWVTPGLMIARKLKAGQLGKLAEETGGRHFKEEADSSKIFKEIEDELRSLYVLGFTLPPGERDGKFHKLEVRSTRRGARVRSRKGYVADK